MNIKSSSFKQTLRAFKYRNYRLFFTGQGISLIGTWMQRIALGWLVYKLTDSAFLLGLVSFSSQIPTFLFASVAGVISDKYNKHRIIVLTQIFAMIQAFILAFLTLTKIVNIWHIIILSMILGFINAFDMPTRQSFVVDMIDDKNDLSNAIALNSSIVNVARLTGPMIAGILISAVGEGLCFLINAVSYIAVIVALLSMRLKPLTVKAKKENFIKGLKEGIKYAYNFIPIRTLLILLAVMSLMGSPYTVLMPVFARDILHGNANTLGFLLGGVGIGALTGAIYLASRKSVLGLGRIIVITGTIFSVGLITFSFSRNLFLSLPLMLFTGFGMIMLMASTNTLLQTLVDDDKRGRVMSLYVMAFMGSMPIGSLIAGSIASRIGAPHTVLIGGIACLIAVLWFAKKLPSLRKSIRPIYVKLGILPEVTKGIQSATN